MRVQLVSSDAIVARIAARQHGAITFAQLLAAGLTQSGVDRRTVAGRLHRVYRGVYAVGHAALSNEGRWMAATLACGEGAVLSHRSAAELWRMLTPARGTVHVTLAQGSSGRARRVGLRIHRPSSLPSAACTLRNGVAVTTAERTLADLRRTATAEDLHRARRQAAFLKLPIGNEGEPDGSRSRLEKRFLSLCRRYCLVAPEVNVPIGPFTVDFLWRERRLVVETDGWEGHRGRQAFEDDRARDLYLRSQGFEVLRLSWRQVLDHPAAVAAVLRRYLG